MARGSNQSIDTKFATHRVCDAISMIESGRIESAKELLFDAIRMLPDVGDAMQERAEAEQQKRGWYARLL